MTTLARSTTLSTAPPDRAADAAGSASRTISGTVEHVIFSRPEDGFGILRLRPAQGGEPVVLVGDLAGFAPGEALRVEGREERDPSWGPRLRVDRVTPLVPTSAEAIAAYLGSGAVKGVGPALARRLLDHFGDRLPDVLSREPGRLRGVRGVGARLAARIAEHWRSRARDRELLVAMQTAGIGPARARRLLETLGDNAAARLAEDPYRVARAVPGIGFATADRLARSLGVDAAAPVRLVAAIEEVLRRAADEGHSCVPEDEATDAAARLVAAPREAVSAALRAARTENAVVAHVLDGKAWLMLAELDRAEAGIAADLDRLSAAAAVARRSESRPASDAVVRQLGLTLSASQSQALDRLLDAKLAVLTGGPGTGKTTLVRALLAALEGSGIDVQLAAPTGRAARRLTEATGHPAATLHRLLEAEPGHGFRRGPTRPIGADLLVVDESSMIDLPLMHATLAALRDEASLLLVGDADQLPPVGPGQVLADLIASARVPVVALEEVFRQAAQSGIVLSAHRIRRGEPPLFERSDAAECFGVRLHSEEDARAKLVELVAERIPERFGIDPGRDVQVLVPTNRGGLGTRELNRLLQQALNPDPPALLEHGGLRFALGDKVMQTENDYQRDVYNGDIGIVTAVDTRAHSLTVRIEGRDVAYERGELDHLVPAYAITVHKAQGSEYPAVVVVLAREHGRMLRRRLLYTAVTRARRLLVLLAEPAALERAVASLDPPRRSLLLPRLRGALGAGT